MARRGQQDAGLIIITTTVLVMVGVRAPASAVLQQRLISGTFELVGGCGVPEHSHQRRHRGGQHREGQGEPGTQAHEARIV